jgi:hypothetical protein
MFKKVLLAALLVVATGLAAKNVYYTQPPQPVAVVSVPSAASGYWRTALSPGFEVTLIAGRYFVVSTGMTTCGAVLRVDVAVPKSAPYSASFYGKGAIYNSTGTPVGFGTPMNLIGPYKPGLVGVLTVDSYNAVDDTLQVTISNTGAGPNGTFTLYRDALSPGLAPANPC